MNTSVSAKPVITGLILAGGRARRMGGGDKCLLPLNGKTLLQHCRERAFPQVDELVLNANGNALRFAHSRLQVVADRFANFPGPLAGIHAGLHWLQSERSDQEWLASFACDTPFFPTDLVTRLLEAALNSHRPLAVAVTDKRMHGVFALWHRSLLPELESTLSTQSLQQEAQQQEGLQQENLQQENLQQENLQQKGQSLQDWIARQSPAHVEFPTLPYDPFFNINTPQDLYAAESLLPLVNQQS